MQKVSRSFAILIPYLEEPLNFFLSTSYLICRVVDNIEDCHQPSTWKKSRFIEFIHLMKRQDSVDDILSAWHQHDWPGLSPDEKKLMGKQGGQLWKIYHRIPFDTRQIICYWIEQMATGMNQMEARLLSIKSFSQSEVKVLANEDDYNQYCYFVAGTVSHLSTALVINHYNLGKDIAHNLYAHCEACGLGLQKTNIIKDFQNDLLRGISYLPDSWMSESNYTPINLQGAEPKWISKVLEDILKALHDAGSYLLGLPYAASGYRMASLLCLLPAYQTILLASRQMGSLFTSGHQLKIPRITMEECLTEATKMLNDNNAIRNYCDLVEQKILAGFAQI